MPRAHRHRLAGRGRAIAEHLLRPLDADPDQVDHRPAPALERTLAGRIAGLEQAASLGEAPGDLPRVLVAIVMSASTKPPSADDQAIPPESGRRRG